MARTPSLESLRAQIDRVDDQLVRLLNQRAALVVQVGHAKSNAAKYVPEREKRIFQRLARMNGGPLRPQHVRTIFREVISSCRALEQPLRVAYLGPAGTYSQQAAAELTARITVVISGSMKSGLVNSAWKWASVKLRGAAGAGATVRL